MENDIRKIQQYLGEDCDPERVAKHLQKHKAVSNRMILAIGDYLKEVDALDPGRVEQDVKLLQELFPFQSELLMRYTLVKLGNEPNRLRMAIREMLTYQQNTSLHNNFNNNNLNNSNAVYDYDANHYENIDSDDDDDDARAMENLNHTVQCYNGAKVGGKRKLDEGEGEDVKVLPKKAILHVPLMEDRPSTSNDHTYNFPLHLQDYSLPKRNSFEGLVGQVGKKAPFKAVDNIISIADVDADMNVVDAIIDITGDKAVVQRCNDEVVIVESQDPVLEEQLPSTCKRVATVNMALHNSLSSVFPDADPEFLKTFCNVEQSNENIASDIINTILSLPSYPLRTVMPPEQTEEDVELLDEESQLEMLKQILPKADPTYLRDKISKFKTHNDFQTFITESLDKHDYPKLEEYERKNRAFAQAKQYTTEFNVKNFLEAIPNPEEYFENLNTKILLHDPKYMNNIYDFLKNTYSKVTVRNIANVRSSCSTIFEACSKLDKAEETMKAKRVPNHLGHVRDIPLLQMFAYMSHRVEIMNHISADREEKARQRMLAKELNLWVTCACCYDEEVMPEDVVKCPSGCICCKSCAQRSIEISFGEGKVDYPCLSDCGNKYSFQYIQKFLSPKLFSKIAIKKQVQEVKAAELEGLEQCPFCDFMTIPPPNDRIFKCLNPDCLKESCRLCNELSHIPLRCDEIEKDEDVQKRVYIENKMTEALIRNCWKCNTKFIKSDGCNKMTCVCGATMCYICNQPVLDYKHFNGQGGRDTHLCPLYSDTNKLHQKAVIKIAKQAKAEIGQSLKIDPTTGIHRYYKEFNQKNPAHVPPGMMFR